MSRIEQLRSLTLRDWRVLAAAAALLPATAALLRLLGVRKTRRVLGGLSSAPSRRRAGHAECFAEAQRVARIVNAVARRSPLRPKCLVRSIVLEALLANRGIGCELKFGTRSDTAKFSAHAWVEHDGIALADPGSADRAVRVLVR